MVKDIDTKRNLETVWAVSLCYASSLIMGIEALQPGGCAWVRMSSEQNFALSALFAALTMFLGTFVLMRTLVRTASIA